jgi:menaquinone-dependent protoporphyrinogen oxidase
VIRGEHLSRLGQLIFKAIGCRYGDYRNWHEIDSWAEHIADSQAGAHQRQ